MDVFGEVNVSSILDRLEGSNIKPHSRSDCLYSTQERDIAFPDMFSRSLKKKASNNKDPLITKSTFWLSQAPQQVLSFISFLKSVGFLATNASIESYSSPSCLRKLQSVLITK